MVFQSSYVSNKGINIFSTILISFDFERYDVLLNYVLHVQQRRSTNYIELIALLRGL